MQENSILDFKNNKHHNVMWCNYHIWALRHIRHLLTEDIAHTLACSIVTSKLDYCNAVLHGVPLKNVAVLQRVQNNLAQVVFQKPKTAHETPLLKSLHWLPVDKRIQYKMILMTYKVKVSKTPDYLSRLISERTSSASMTLRSSSRTLRRPKFTRTNYGGRGFSASAPAIWNDLPADFNFSDSLNIFKKRLKTFFQLCFPITFQTGSYIHVSVSPDFMTCKITVYYYYYYYFFFFFYFFFFNLDLVALVLRLCGHCANYACSVALLKRHRQPLKQKSGFAPVTSHCRNAITEFMQKFNSLRAPVARDLTCQRNENVVTSQLLVFLVFLIVFLVFLLIIIIIIINYIESQLKIWMVLRLETIRAHNTGYSLCYL